MRQLISIIIPNYNGGLTIGRCLESIYGVRDDDVEVIVVDDGSQDGSVEIIKKYPCKLIRLENHAGAAAARNAGVAAATGTVLLFIDADCLIREDTLSAIRRSLSGHPDAVLGGTYTQTPADPGFFNQFQSVFINHSETNSISPDYIATHAMIVPAATFRRVGGFAEKFLPILEDVEFSHRLRRAGASLIMNPDIQVRHIFNFSLLKSLRNAVRKTRYWSEYSLANKDIFVNSGTASRGIKINGGCWLLSVLSALSSIASGQSALLATLPILWLAGIAANRSLLLAFYRTGGIWFALAAGAYYVWVYPAAIWIGAGRGIFQYLIRNRKRLDGGSPRPPVLPGLN